MIEVFYSNIRFSEKPRIGTPAAKATGVSAGRTGECETRRMEIIQARATKEHELRTLVAELGRSLDNEFVEFTGYRHATIETADLSVHLVHETVDDIKPRQRFADTLGEDGLVNHSLWVEVQPKKNS